MEQYTDDLTVGMSAGKVVVQGKEVSTKSQTLQIALDSKGRYRLFSTEERLSWWRRQLVKWAYR